MSYLEHGEYKDLIKLMVAVLILGGVLTLGIFLLGYNYGAKSTVGFALGAEYGKGMEPPAQQYEAPKKKVGKVGQ